MNLKSQFTKEKLKKKKKIYILTLLLKQAKKFSTYQKKKRKNTNIPFLFSPSLFSRKNIKTGPI